MTHFSSLLSRLLVVLLMVSLALSGHSVPAKRGIWRTLRLADGTAIQVQKLGDEHLHFYTDGLGRHYLCQANGRLQAISATDLRARYARQKSRRLTAKAKARAAAKPARVTHFGQVDKANYQGTQRGLIILVEFSDLTFNAAQNKAFYERLANERNFRQGSYVGSLNDYFTDQSYGQFDLQFDIVGPVRLAHPYAYYGANDSEGNDVRVGMMVGEACQAAADEVDFSRYDWDGDGEVDQVYVIYAGLGEADSNDSDSVWPCSWTLGESEFGRALSFDGVTINQFACSNERTEEGKAEGIGTICHEFSHCMGFPDTYDIVYGGNFGMNAWDLMDSGSYGGDGFIPVGYNAYQRMLVGWNEPIELVGDTTLTGIKDLSDGGATYIIYNKGCRDEYFLIENRQPTLWDQTLPAFGVLVTHVDFDQDIWDYNIVNTTIDLSEYGMGNVKNDHQRLTILHADNDDDAKYWSTTLGGYTKNTLESDPYPYRNNDSITNTSRPAAVLYNRNLNGTRLLNVAVTGIRVAEDGTASFSFRDFSHEAGGGSDVEGLVFYESFNGCQGKGGNDGDFSGTQVGVADLLTDHDGWTYEMMKGAYECVKTGSNKKSGKATTPDFELTGEATLTFLAAPYSNDGTTLTLSGSGGVEISPSTFTLTKGEWTLCTATISALGPSTITFTPAKRMLLDEVKIVAASKDGITDVTTHPAAKAWGIYNLNGQREANGPLPRGVYIKDGRKVLVK